jgi:hypothetical protein
MTRMTWMFAAVMFASAAPTANASPVYSNFVTFNGPGNSAGGTTANAISNAGAIVGFSSDNAAAPTLFTNFVLNPNQTFTPLNVFSDPLANANGINSAGTVVGFSGGNAFYRDSGTSGFLPFATGTTTSETAFGINDHNTIVGQFVDSGTGMTPGFVYSAGGTFTILNPVVNAAVTNAQSINDNGIVAGFYSTDGVHQHGFLYNTNTAQYTLAPDPSQPNLVLVQFLGINDQGLVAGYWQDTAGSQHGLLYNISTQTYTFLDDPNADLGTGIQITQITGINDSGEIEGFYVDPTNGLQSGFYATPNASAVPEPPSVFLFAGGMLMVVALQILRRRRGYSTL